MLKLKLQYFGHLMRGADLLERTLVLGKTESKRRGQQRMRWLDSVTNSVDMSLSELQEMAKDSGARRVVVHGVVGSRTQLSDWTTGGKGYWRERLGPVLGKKGKWKREAATFPPVCSLPGERHPCGINADPHPWGLRAGISASGGTPAINSLWTHNNWVSPWEGKRPSAGGRDRRQQACKGWRSVSTASLATVNSWQFSTVLTTDPPNDREHRKRKGA